MIDNTHAFNISNGLKKLLEIYPEVKLSFSDNVFFTSIPVVNETLEDIRCLESFGWEEIEYRWIYRLKQLDSEDEYYDTAYEIAEERMMSYYDFKD